MKCSCQTRLRGAAFSAGPMRMRVHRSSFHAGASQKCFSSSSRQPISELSRRQTLQLLSGGVLLSLCSPSNSSAAFQVPPGTRLHYDKFDGYYFLYPDTWSPNTTTGNDVFYRNPFLVAENLFVDVSSPSSSRFQSVEDLGTPEEAANTLLDQYLNKEFMSTRLGIKREGEVVSASSRVAPDGKEYYDVDIRLKSYGSTNPYSITREEVMNSYALEWDRHLLTTLGVANQRLYELRIQTDTDQVEADASKFQSIQQSFRCKEVDS